MKRICWVLGVLILGACGTLPRTTESGGLKVMTLNLHTWQETQAEEKLQLVADYIAQEKLDVVLLQEVGQHEEAPPLAENLQKTWAPFQDPEDPLFVTGPKTPGNGALILCEMLQKHHSQGWKLVWTQAHKGFGVYQEGVAILSKHPILGAGSRYVSSAVTTEEVSARKVLWADVEIPEWGPIRFFTAHLGWGGDQDFQIKNMRALAEGSGFPKVLVGGDFNLGPEEPGYQTLFRDGIWQDDYFRANPEGVDDITCGKRIDYILTPQGFPGNLVEARRYFREEDDLGPRVSDHAAVIVQYQRKP